MTNVKNFFKIQNGFLVESALLIIVTLLILISLPALTNAATLDRQLQVGMSGSDVSSLQSFLAQDNTIYPQGLVTGYFGPLTYSAVSNFQARNGIATVGRVGPITLAAINAQMGGGIGGSDDVIAPSISNVNVNKNNSSSVTFTWNTNESATGVVYYSTSPLSTYENLHSVTVTGGNNIATDNNLRTSQSLTVTGLQSNTTYYYLVYVTDIAGNVSIMWDTFRTNS